MDIQRLAGYVFRRIRPYVNIPKLFLIQGDRDAPNPKFLCPPNPFQKKKKI